jgi:YD repeat-containing protein
VSNPSQGVTLYGPSGFAAYFASDGNGGFKDAPGLNATIKMSGGNYQLKFHHTELQWLFNGNYGTLYAIQDTNGNLIAFSYDGNGNLTSLTDTQGRAVTFTQNAAHQITAIKDSTGRITTYAYNSNVDLTSITNTNNGQTGFGYDSQDRVTSITDPNGKSTGITYTSSGQVATITDANNGVTRFTYNSGNTVVTDANGHATTYAYNSQLQVTGTTDALGHCSTSTYDATNYNVTQTGDPLSDFSNFVFSTDGHNNLLTDSEGANGSDTGAKTTYTYPSSGNNMYHPTSQVDPQGNETDYTYDSNGNLLTTTYHKTGKTLTYTYNSNGTVATQTDFDGINGLGLLRDHNRDQFRCCLFGRSCGGLPAIAPPSAFFRGQVAVPARRILFLLWIRSCWDASAQIANERDL